MKILFIYSIFDVSSRFGFSRSEKDRAFVIFMDKRYDWGIYKSIIKNFITITKSNNYLDSIDEFNLNDIKTLDKNL